jgi:hypothetical protein
MKSKLLLMSLILGTLLLLAGTGTALADWKGRGHGYGYHKRPVVVHPVRHKVVYNNVVPRHSVVYGRPIPCHYPVYVERRPVIVRHVPVYVPVVTGWGLSIHFGY